MFTRMLVSPLLRVALLAAALPIPALACPPSLTVEVPSGPPMRDVFLLVHAAHGCHPGQLTVSGIAEGLVGGERRSIRLEFVPTSSEGVYAVRRQWPLDGVWVLNLAVAEGDGHMTTLVGIGPSGEVKVVQGPIINGRSVRPASGADVDALLRTLAAG